jgi:hypothetical protein
MVVSAIGLPELIPGPPGGGIRGADAPEAREKVHRAIDRHEVDTVGARAGVDLPGGHRHPAVTQHFQHKPTRGNEAIPSRGQHD